MFKAKKENNSITNTVIGEDIKIEGATITGSGSLRIDGEFFGDISIDGNITIGETGYVKGNLKVNHALLAGKVDGNVASKNGVHLASTATLNGNVDASALVVDEGAVFSGSCNMSKTNDSFTKINVNTKENIDTKKEPEIEFSSETDSNLTYTKK